MPWKKKKLLLALLSNQISPKCSFCRVHLIDCILEQEYTEIFLQIYFSEGFGSLKYKMPLNIVFQPHLYMLRLMR